ncbi:uncharacterized protein METZ01_LOCUS439960 [marine metagenome]|uniref:Uncharacterized protein n=1 Tax=marine metagenome TaxID=408172 RepID=A0A382YV06_9ZZZZ
MLMKHLYAALAGNCNHAYWTRAILMLLITILRRLDYWFK